MTERTYAIVLDCDGEVARFAASVPALPSRFTQGRTVEEATDPAKNAIALHIECLIEDSEPVPEEKEPAQLARGTVAA